MPDRRKKARRSPVRKSKNVDNKENNNKELTCVMSLFRESEDTHAHERLITRMKLEFFNKLDLKEFCEDYFDCCRYLFMVEDRHRAENSCMFAVKFIIHCLEIRDNTNRKNIDNLFKKFIGFLLWHHNVIIHNVRFQVTQFFKFLLSELTENIDIPDFLFINIQDALLHRLWDVKSFTRANAAAASSRLQDPSSAVCPIVVGLMHLVRYDTCHKVRLEAMQSLAITTKTLPVILGRCNDVNDLIRKKAYELIAKWKILKPLTITKRLQIIENGLNDKCELVRNACVEMIKVWYDVCEKDPLVFLKRLDVENGDYVSKLTLNSLLKSMEEENILELINLLKSMMDEKNLITHENLSGESSFLWRHLINFMTHNQPQYSDKLESILPSMVNFESYLKDLFQRASSHDNTVEDEIHNNLESLAILKHLLPITKHLEIFDEHNRQMIISLIRWALSSKTVSHQCVEHLMKLLVHINGDKLKLCDISIELINELLFDDAEQEIKGTEKNENKPVISSSNNDEATHKDLTGNNGDLSVDESVIFREKQRKKKIELAQLDVRLNELNESIQNRMADVNEVDGCSKLFEELKNIQFQRQRLKDDLQTLKKPNSLDEHNINLATDNDNNESEEMEAEDVGASKCVPKSHEIEFMKEGNEEIIIKACSITICMIQECNLLWELTPPLRSLFENVILVSVQHKNLLVRENAFLALGLCCLLDKELAVKYHSVFIQCLNIDHDSIKNVAIKSIIDLFLRFGIEPFQDALLNRRELELSESHDKSIEPKSLTTLDSTGSSEKRVVELTDEDYNKCTMELLNPIITLLNSQVPELQTDVAIGLSKLMYNQKLMSSKLLSRLLLLWFNPNTMDNAKLRHHLATMFTNFSLMSVENQITMSDCFLPTIKTLFKASVESPLYKIDVNNVSDFFIKVTDSKFLLQNRVKMNKNGKIIEGFKDCALKENPCHDDIAVILCQQILRMSYCAESKHYLTMLPKLRLSSSRIQVFNNLQKIVHTINTNIRDKRVLHVMKKYELIIKEHIDEYYATNEFRDNLGDNSEDNTLLGDTTTNDNQQLPVLLETPNSALNTPPGSHPTLLEINSVNNSKTKVNKTLYLGTKISKIMNNKNVANITGDSTIDDIKDDDNESVDNNKNNSTNNNADNNDDDDDGDDNDVSIVSESNINDSITSTTMSDKKSKSSISSSSRISKPDDAIFKVPKSNVRVTRSSSKMSLRKNSSISSTSTTDNVSQVSSKKNVRVTRKKSKSKK